MSRPHWVELHDDEPADLAGTVHYLDADPVRVHRTDPLAPSWTCATHGQGATCGHVLAVALTERARDVLTIPDA